MAGTQIRAGAPSSQGRVGLPVSTGVDFVGGFNRLKAAPGANVINA